MDGPFSIIKEQLELRILSNLLCCSKGYHSIIVTNYDTSFVLGMYLLTDSLLFDDINCSHSFFDDPVIISWEYFVKGSVYFTSLIAVTHCNKRSVIDSRKFEGYCVYFRKVPAVLVFRGACLSHKTSCNIFCLKSAVSNLNLKIS